MHGQHAAEAKAAQLEADLSQQQQLLQAAVADAAQLDAQLQSEK